MIDAILLIVIGWVAGALAAALGVGGGIVLVPALALTLGFGQHLAQGTSLAVIFPTAIVATLGHARASRVSWRLAFPAAITAMVGGLVAARIALALDGDVLQRLFSLFLAVIAVRLAVQAWRARRDSAAERD